MPVEDLDGHYQIVFHADLPGEDARFYTVAYGHLLAGRFAARDDGGCLWCGQFDLAEGNEEVRGVVIIDPRPGNSDAAVMTRDGTAVREPVEFTCSLRIHKGADGDLRFGGAVPHGPVTFEVMLKRVAGLDG